MNCVVIFLKIACLGMEKVCIKNLENGNQLWTVNFNITLPNVERIEIRTLPRDPKDLLKFLPSIKKQINIL